MGRFARFLGRLLKPFKDMSGVSLYETTAVVAMTAVIASVAVPMAMDRLENAKSTRAVNEVVNIGDAMQKFFEHTGRWPGEVEIRKAGNSFCFLQTGIPSTDSSKGTLLPDITSLGTSAKPFDAGEFLGRPCNTITATNVLNINDYLVRKPNEADYPNWQGPYIQPVPSDPWDRAYVINVLPLMFASTIEHGGVSGTFADTGGKVGYGWVMTVGPDRLLQTAFTSPQLQPGTDDIGKNMGARIVKSAGGGSASGN